MNFVVATTTLHSEDLVTPFLDHLRAVGAERVLVMDLGSHDRTLDLLRQDRFRGFVDLVSGADIATADPSNILLAEAKLRFPDAWCMFCDPDELVSPSIRTYQVPAGVSCLELRRNNVTGLRENLSEGGVIPWEHLVLKVARDVRRDSAAFSGARMDPPWIFSRVMDKIVLQLSAAQSIGAGDHSAALAFGLTERTDSVFLQHYPLRSWQAFLTKVETIEQFFQHHPDLPPAWGEHWRRWVRLLRGGSLKQEYLDQFIENARLAAMLDGGVIERVESPLEWARTWSGS
jgi:hypothetical protein